MRTMLDFGEWIFQTLVGFGEAIAHVLPIEVLIGLFVLVVITLIVLASLLAGA